ncbi:MAG: DegT/DnrJ/EryC1/StrS family aminotransferase [Cyclobacteriaceae bacterium]
MRSIQMVDLKNQYLQIKEEIDASILKVLNETRFIKGPEVRNFENELGKYLRVRNVIGCGNGTDALQVAFMALDLKPGDEVITTDFSFVATVEAIALLGLIPVLVDADPNSFNIDATAIENVITSRTKAIVPVHLFGQCSDMEPIMKIAQKYQLAVVEDAAQAMGAEYTFSDGSVKKAGTIGDIGTTSFFPTKNLACYGDGGALLTNDDALGETIRSIINHGSKVKYNSERIGVNSRLDTMQAAILRVKLKYLDNFNRSRQIAASYYNEKLEGMKNLFIPVKDNQTTHIFHQYTLKVNGSNRSKFRQYLEDQGIPTMIYYPVPMHLQQAFTDMELSKGYFPITEDLCKSVVSLPMHTELDKTQLQYITDQLKNFTDL